MNPSSSLSIMEQMKRDRFELLSAYLDGEVTSEERHQVETWLAHDPQVQRLHQRLLSLRQGFGAMPMPSADYSADQLVQGVFQTLERRKRRRLGWGGAAIAAMAVGAVSWLVPGTFTPSPQLATLPDSNSAGMIVPDDALMIALDQPIVDIPALPTSPNPKGNKQEIY
ncbi:MAG: transcriptional regulator [Synechococcales cyanobacterium K44_A2020_017]|jgi:anti-sigma factor RsiW|uniref:anti-sigma factor family protein n=1 Tax=Leptolyngbya sp. CCY15150 TaxID=2767772 RepID=UPI00194FC788|nr:Fis family transcriptional regulator [Leptolyngbya sp. CCY15150]MBF2095771.1 transcriptional regulator [Synechococcales cyanobacterium K44_A2020_017]